MTNTVKFYDGKEYKTPVNWKAMLAGGYPGDEHFLVLKKFPQKTDLHPNPLSDEEKEAALWKKKFPVKQPTVEVEYYTSSDAGQAYYNIVDRISGVYPKESAQYGDQLFRTKREVRGGDIPGAVKCAVHAMNYFSQNSPKIFDKKLVMDRTEDQLKACLISETSAAKFEFTLPERWKKEK